MNKEEKKKCPNCEIHKLGKLTTYFLGSGKCLCSQCGRELDPEEVEAANIALKKLAKTLYQEAIKKDLVNVFDNDLNEDYHLSLTITVRELRTLLAIAGITEGGV